MKKWIVRIGGIFLLVLVVLIVAAFWSDSDRAVVARHTETHPGVTIKPDWPGTPVDQKGRFVNHEFPFLPETRDLLKWQLGSNPFSEEKRLDTFRPNVLDPSAFLQSEADGMIWLGHASFYIRLNGIGILLDPVFGDPPLITRFTDVPTPLDQIEQVDMVLLSHDHRDHMDEATIRQIARKFPNAEFLAGLGSEDVLGAWTNPTNRSKVAGWFERFDIDDAKVEIYFLPVRHWSRRGLFDTNKRLWGGFVIRTEEVSLYFGGDSGFGSHYRETRELFPDIDYFLIGIGAYEPRWFMEPNHNNPADVVKAFQEIGAKWLVPMHFGTFDLSDEPPGEPLRALTSAAEKAKITNKIKVLQINGSIRFGQ
jgi:L-ascorbate metabolism protein UlaG (beta-lactamase superfamily)